MVCLTQVCSFILQMFSWLCVFNDCPVWQLNWQLSKNDIFFAYPIFMVFLLACSVTAACKLVGEHAGKVKGMLTALCSNGVVLGTLSRPQSWKREWLPTISGWAPCTPFPFPPSYLELPPGHPFFTIPLESSHSPSGLRNSWCFQKFSEAWVSCENKALLIPVWFGSTF